MSPLTVTRHPSAESFLDAAQALLMLAEAENNLIIGVAQGLARNPAAAGDPYLATVSGDHGVLACAVHLGSSKLVLTRANREPIVALAEDVYAVRPGIEGITGPLRSAGDFALAWGRLSGIEPALSMRMRIHEARRVNDAVLKAPSGSFRKTGQNDVALLTAWTADLTAEIRIPEKVDAARVVSDAIRRERLFVWDDGGRPVSMAAWSGKTPNGVRIIFVYTPRELRNRGYATACVAELTRRQLTSGSSFCWLYTDLSSAAAPNIFKKIGYWPVSDVAEYSFR